MDKEYRLFKDNPDVNTKSRSAECERGLLSAIESGNITIFLLSGLDVAQLEPYRSHGRYIRGKHNRCDGFSTETSTEKRICKCLYYKNSNFPASCDTCKFRSDKQYTLTEDYQILDYEVPAFYYSKNLGIGEIDLIISDGATEYATEVKPYGSRETLLRMIAETLTYTLGDETHQYRPAIAFFVGSEQENQYKKASETIRSILEKAEITVFQFKVFGDKDKLEICKL